MNESELYPYSPNFTFNGYYSFPKKVFPSVNNFGKKYYLLNNHFPPNKKINYWRHTFSQRRNITENDKNFEENEGNYNSNYLKDINRKNPYNYYNNRKAISSRINKDINDYISQYINNLDSLNKQNFMNKTNPNWKSFYNNKISEEKPSFIKSSKSRTKKEKNINEKLLYKSNKSLNPSSFNGFDQAKTNYTTYYKNSNKNLKSGNNILSNVNSVSSRINETNNGSHFFNGIKMISGVNEYFYDFNKNNNIEQKEELSIQTISDSKMLELASKYVDKEEDNTSENFQMNNILHNKKKFISKNINI